MILQNLKIPKLIHKTSSPHNELIEVFEVGEHKRLGVNGVVQSISWDEPSVERRFWGQVEGIVFEKKPQAKNILLMGLGGGTMLHLFNRDMPEAHVTVIEIDSEMIKVAEEHFGLKDLTNYSVINEDIMRVMIDPEKYDLHRNTFDAVIVDIFCGLDFPELGTTGQFFAGIKWFLNSGGLVVVNRIYVEEVRHEVDEFVENMKELFENVGTVTVPGRTNSDNLLVYGEVSH